MHLKLNSGLSLSETFKEIKKEIGMKHVQAIIKLPEKAKIPKPRKTRAGTA